MLILIPALVVLLSVVLLNKKYHMNIFIKKNFGQFYEVVALSPPFKVINLSVISDNPLVVEKIKNNLDLDFPLSSLDINVGILKKQVESINLVQSASVRLTSNGLIEITASGREAVVIQRIGEKLSLLDINGVEVDEIASRSQRLDLPLLVGKGSQNKVKEALNLLLETKSLIVRIRGLVRIGERRWDMILNNNQVIKLPADQPLKAIKKVVALHKGRSLLDRDILYLDLRNINKPVLGLTEDISNQLRDVRNFVRGENI